MAKVEPSKCIEKVIMEKIEDAASSLSSVNSNRRRLKIFQNITLTKSSGGSSGNGSKKKTSPL